jgi:hypothetical protein
MDHEPSDPGCIRLDHGNGGRLQHIALQWVEANGHRMLLELGRNGQSASAGLFSLSNRCWDAFLHSTAVLKATSPRT